MNMKANRVRLNKSRRRAGRLPSFGKRDYNARLRVYDFLEKKYDLNFANKYYWLFTSVFAALTRGWTRPMFRQPTEHIFLKALKSKAIRKVAEVGPGEDGMLLRMAGLFRKAGCKMSVIGTGINTERCKNAGIAAIDGWAGQISSESARNFDLVIAKDVFSFGGSAEQDFGKDSLRNAIDNATNGTLDLVRRLSGNKNATIVLTEDIDALLVDRKKIEPFARVIRWERLVTNNGMELRTKGEHELELGWIDQSHARVVRESPNVIVLQKRIAAGRKK